MVHYKKVLAVYKTVPNFCQSSRPFTAVKPILPVKNIIFQINAAQLLVLAVSLGHANIVIRPTWCW